MKNLKLILLVAVLTIAGYFVFSAIRDKVSGSYKDLYMAARDSLDAYRVQNIKLLEVSNQQKDSTNKQLASDIIALRTEINQLKQTDIQNQKKHNAINEKLKAIPDRIRSLGSNPDSLRRAFADF